MVMLATDRIQYFPPLFAFLIPSHGVLGFWGFGVLGVLQVPGVCFG